MNKIKAIKQRKVLANVEIVKGLQDDFGVCRSMVYNALKYGSNSRKAQAIRNKAVTEYGCKIVNMPILTTV